MESVHFLCGILLVPPRVVAVSPQRGSGIASVLFTVTGTWQALPTGAGRGLERALEPTLPRFQTWPHALPAWWPWASCFINFALWLPHWKGAVILQPCWSVERVRGIHRWHKGVCVCECIKHITWHWVADGRCSGRGSCHLDVISQEVSPVH